MDFMIIIKFGLLILLGAICMITGEMIATIRYCKALDKVHRNLIERTARELKEEWEDECS